MRSASVLGHHGRQTQARPARRQGPPSIRELANVPVIFISAYG